MQGKQSFDFSGGGYNQLEDALRQEMIANYETVKDSCGYRMTRLMQKISQIGALAAAKDVIRNEGASGFATLYSYGLLKYSVENLIIKKEYQPLFTDEERRICRERLEKYKGGHRDE